MKYTEEQIQRADNVSLIEYFHSHGYNCEKQGKDIRVHGFGGLIITNENKYFCFSQQKGGYGAIKCLTDMLNMKFPEAMRELIGEEPEQSKDFNSGHNKTADNKINNSVPQAAEKYKKEFIMPEKDSDCKRVYAYLINQRKISPELITALVKQNALFQDKNGNAVFLHFKDGQAIGAEIQGTLSESRFKGVAAGTSNSSFSFSKGNPDTAYIFESSIDMMSFIQLHPEIQNAEFHSMAGLKPTVVNQLAERGLKIVSCVDNDEAGANFNKRLLENMKNSEKLIGRTFITGHSEEFFKVNDECARENVKDFNELLCKRVQEKAELPKEKQTLSKIMAAVHEKMQNSQNVSNRIKNEVITDVQK